jgi:hypothetical protein
VANFVRTHLLQYHATAGVLVGEPVKVTVEMTCNLALSFFEKTEAHTIPGKACGKAYCKRAGIPEWRKSARAAPEFFGPFPAPGQVVVFFIRGRKENVAQSLVGSGQSLGTIQRLGSDFTGVVDSHQAG